MQRLRHLVSLTYAQKLSLVAAIPLVVAVAAIAVLVAYEARATAEREIEALERSLIEAKKEELRNYVTQARNGFAYIYGRAEPDDEVSKNLVSQILSAMIYGQDGFFFVYDYDGNNLVSPRQTQFINRNWEGLTDSDGTPIVDEFIRLAGEYAGKHCPDINSSDYTSVIDDRSFQRLMNTLEDARGKGATIVNLGGDQQPNEALRKIVEDDANREEIRMTGRWQCILSAITVSSSIVISSGSCPAG